MHLRLAYVPDRFCELVYVHVSIESHGLAPQLECLWHMAVFSTTDMAQLLLG